MARNELAVGSKDDPRAVAATLWRAYTKSPSERRHEALWRSYQPLVRHIAERFNDKAGGMFEAGGLVNAGNVGLLDAIAEFDSTTEARFETLAVPMIRQAIARSLAVQRAKDKDHTLRLELAEAIASCGETQGTVLPEEAAMHDLIENLRRERRATN